MIAVVAASQAALMPGAIVAFIVVVGLTFWRGSKLTVVLGEDAIEVVSLFRRRTVPTEELRSLETYSAGLLVFPGSYGALVLKTRSGDSVKMPMLTGTSMFGFESNLDVSGLIRWCAEHDVETSINMKRLRR